MKQAIRTLVAKILRRKPLVIRQGSPECFKGMPLRVSWDVTSHCNFRCSYCYYAGKEYKKDFCTLEQAETAIRHLASANRPSYQVNLLGGEPTTHPHLAEIITLLHQYLGDRLKVLEIISNGSFGEDKMEAVLNAGGGIRLKLNISVHLEYMNVERVVELVKRYSLRTHLKISLMFHPKWIDKAMAVADALCDLRRDYPFGMSVDMLNSPPDFDRFDSRYTEEHFNVAKKIRERFGKANSEGPKMPENRQEVLGWKFLVERNVNGSIEIHEQISPSKLNEMMGNAFTDMVCCAGTSVAWIRVDGSVKGMICGLDRPVCNIFEENPFLREDWMHGVVCSKAMCGCNVNYRIPKFRSPADAKKFIEKKKIEQKKLMSNH